MSASSSTADVAREWVGKAENNLTNATHTLKLGSAAPTDTICFHVQQCVEKYLKALLVVQKIQVPKTHNIGLLIDLLPSEERPELAEDEKLQLTLYATDSRYPEAQDISLSEARNSIRLARRVRSEIRRKLPKAALTVRKPPGKPKRKP